MFFTVRRYIVVAFFAALCVLTFGRTGAAQSIDPSFPTAVVGSEISGVIAARDVGDARVTTHYFSFEAGSGDVFVNVSTVNFTGDIDIFDASGSRSLSKIVVYADLANNETGRVIYLRKPEKLILRVQGRSPGDEPASYRIKFAGSFIASSRPDAPPEPDMPRATVGSDTGIRVNSVGTIIKVDPTPKQIAAAAERDEAARRRTEIEKSKEKATNVSKNNAEAITRPKADNSAPVAAKKADKLPRRPLPERSATAKSDAPAKTEIRRRTVDRLPSKPAQPEPVAAAADPLANIRLLIEFKDGKTIDRPMSEVFKFSVDKGVLTVISKDGSVGRYPILDVAKVTIK